MLASLLDLIAPPRCAGCRSSGEIVCEACLAALDQFDRPPEQEVAGIAVRPAFHFHGVVREVIHAAKYGDARAANQRLAGLAAARLVIPWEPPPQLIVPVPLAAGRMRWRGYNQVEALAEALGERSGAVAGGALERQRATRIQATLATEERAANVAGAFRWASTLPPTGTVWLVDDVCTTGATLSAAAAALLSAGAEVVTARVLAAA